MLYMCTEYHISVNMYHVSAQGVDERMINVHYYYYYHHHHHHCNAAIVFITCTLRTTTPKQSKPSTPVQAHRIIDTRRYH